MTSRNARVAIGGVGCGSIDYGPLDALAPRCAEDHRPLTETVRGRIRLKSTRMLVEEPPHGTRMAGNRRLLVRRGHRRTFRDAGGGTRGVSV